MKKIILLADDDADDQQLLSEALEMTDDQYILRVVSSAREVMKYLEDPDSVLPNLIILDYNMPDNNGAEVIDLIMQHPRFKKIPVIVWSTSDSAIYKKICEEKGARSYFQKPTSFSGLLDVTREMINFASAF